MGEIQSRNQITMFIRSEIDKKENVCKAKLHSSKVQRRKT